MGCYDLRFYVAEVVIGRTRSVIHKTQSVAKSVIHSVGKTFGQNDWPYRLGIRLDQSKDKHRTDGSAVWTVCKSSN